MSDTVCVCPLPRAVNAALFFSEAAFYQIIFITFLIFEPSVSVTVRLEDELYYAGTL